MALVLSTGIAVLDSVFALEGPVTPGLKHRARSVLSTIGGNAANRCNAVVRLAGEARLAARFGSDPAAQVLRAMLAARGIDAGLCHEIEGAPTTLSCVLVDPEGERTIANYVDPRLVAGSEGLPEVLPPGTGCIAADTRWEDGARHLMQLARTAGLPAVFDADRAPRLPDTLEMPSHVVFSAQALAEFSGTADLREGLRKVAGASPRFHAVTDGARGVWHLRDGVLGHCPAFAVTAKDTLAAGDVWNGAFALALAERMPEDAALRFAAAVAAIKVTRFGGSDGTPARAEVETFMKENGR